MSLWWEKQIARISTDIFIRFFSSLLLPFLSLRIMDFVTINKIWFWWRSRPPDSHLTIRWIQFSPAEYRNELGSTEYIIELCSSEEPSYHKHGGIVCWRLIFSLILYVNEFQSIRTQHGRGLQSTYSLKWTLGNDAE